MSGIDTGTRNTEQSKCDLIFRNPHVIDPSQGINGVLDVGIRDGLVSAFGERCRAIRGKLEIDLRGKYLCPGFVNLHGHWYEGSCFGVDPEICLNQGVTTVVDAGTTGFINFPEFRRNRIVKSRVQILAFIHLACLGLPTIFVGELEDLRFARPKETVRTIENNRDVILGVKIRQGAMVANDGLEALEKALTVGRQTRLPLMVHIGKGARTPEILSRLGPGDIVTHCFQGRGDGILTDTEDLLLPEVIEGRKRGVIFDVGHGCASFSWEMARKAFEHAFYPDTISTDLHRFSIERWAIDMPTTMSKFLHVGMSLKEVILKSTWAPAQAIGRQGSLGTLREGTIADLVVFDLEEGEFEFEDTLLHVEKACKRIRPLLVVKKGRIFEPGSYPISLRELYDCDHDFLKLLVESTEQNRLAPRPMRSRTMAGSQ